jgi:hypothetical protein
MLMLTASQSFKDLKSLLYSTDGIIERRCLRFWLLRAFELSIRNFRVRMMLLPGLVETAVLVPPDFLPLF